MTDQQIFLQIWTSPRKVFRFIQETKYEKHLKILLFLVGVSRAFDRASMKDMGDSLSLFPLIAACVIGGGLLGWMSYYFYAWLVAWTGNILKGRGDFEAILRVITYGSVPLVVGLLFLIPQIGVYGIEVFQSESTLINAGLFGNLIFWSSLLIELLLAIWTIVLCTIGTSEIQGLSIGKSILNLLLPVAVILIPIGVFALVYNLIW